jgi:hypothetical protein
MWKGCDRSVVGRKRAVGGQEDPNSVRDRRRIHFSLNPRERRHREISIEGPSEILRSLGHAIKVLIHEKKSL